MNHHSGQSESESAFSQSQPGIRIVDYVMCPISSKFVAPSRQKYSRTSLVMFFVAHFSQFSSLFVHTRNGRRMGLRLNYSILELRSGPKSGLTCKVTTDFHHDVEGEVSGNGLAEQLRAK